MRKTARKVHEYPAPITDPQTGLKLSISMRNISPNQAQRILDRNSVDQRRVCRFTVARYARQMASGLWNSGNGEAIKISSDGDLLDGQHRLLAVVEADINVDFLVIGGIHADNMVSIDDGRVRSLKDILTINNTLNGRADVGVFSKNIKSMFTFYNVIVKGKAWSAHRSNRGSNSELVRLVDKNPSLLETYDHFFDLFHPTPIKQSIGSAIPFLLWHVFRGGVYESYLAQLLKTMEEQTSQDAVHGAKSPSFVLYKALLKIRMQSKRTVFTSRDYLNLTLWALAREVEYSSASVCKITLICDRKLEDNVFFDNLHDSFSKLDFSL